MEKVELSQLFTEENKYRYDSISINNEFAKMIISSIPENITQLEKAIYVYIKLCKLLSYDDEFLLYITRALSKKEMSSTNHTKIDNLANINESNNSVVCWEFVAIYGKILSMIGINSYVYDTELFEDAPVEVVDEREYFEQRYGKWHPGFAVNVDNQIFSISINAMVGDLSLAKHNYELKEIKSLHNDEEEKKKFKETINKVYGMVTNGAEIKPYNFEKEVDAKINQIAKTTKIPGFRPGKAPKEMLKQKYRASVLGEVLDETVGNATEEVIKSNKLNPVMMPNIKVTKFEDGKDIEFTLTVELMPEIKIGNLSAIKLEKLMAEVPAEEVEKALNYIAQSRRETVKVEEDRAAAKGDTVVIDFTGSIDGVEFQGGKGNNYPLELGSNSFIPGFEDQLIGKKAGDKVDVNVTFPENYHAKDLAGKASVFAVEIKELRAAKEVEINDEFAKSLGEENLDKLKAAIAERIKGDYEAASKMKLKRQLLDNLDNEYKFDVPAGLVDAEYKSIVDQYKQAKKYNQLDESEKNKSEEELLAEYKDIAVRRVKLGLLLSEIGKDAKVTITPDDINKAIMNEAKKYPGQEKAVFDYYLKNKQAIEALKAPVFEEKIVDYVIGKSNVSEKIVSIEELYSFDEDKKAGKKTTAKKSAKKSA